MISESESLFRTAVATQEAYDKLVHWIVGLHSHQLEPQFSDGEKYVLKIMAEATHKAWDDHYAHESRRRHETTKTT